MRIADLDSGSKNWADFGLPSLIYINPIAAAVSDECKCQQTCASGVPSAKEQSCDNC